MGCPVLGASGITAACASAAMSMVTMKTEKNYHVIGFSTQLVPININPQMRLDAVMNKISSVRNNMYINCFPIEILCIQIVIYKYFEFSRFQWAEQIVLNQCCGL